MQLKTKTRNEVQSEAANTIISKGFNGIIAIAPRVGKSKIVCDAIKELKSGKILITAPYNTILDSWETEFKKWKVNPNSKKKPIKVINQRSLVKEDLESYDIIICDEVHTLSDTQLTELQYVSSKTSILGVTGSMSAKTKKTLRETLNLNKIYEFSIEDAIESGIIANYEIILYPIKLDYKDKYIEGGNKQKKFMTTEGQTYTYLTSQFDKFKRMSWGNQKFESIKMSAASKRASFIYTSKTKLEAAKDLISKQERCLIFTARTEIADNLATGYHSKSEDSVLTDFMDGNINQLAVCEMTNMGITFPNLKVGIFHQMKSSEESAIQKVMRMCNLEDDETAQIHILYYDSTVDEEWVSKALIGLNPEKIRKDYTYFK